MAVAGYGVDIKMSERGVDIRQVHGTVDCSSVPIHTSAYA